MFLSSWRNGWQCFSCQEVVDRVRSPRLVYNCAKSHRWTEGVRLKFERNSQGEENNGESREQQCITGRTWISFHMNGLGAKHLQNERWNVGWEGERFRCNTTRYYKIERKLDNLMKYKYLDSVFFVFFEIFSFEEKSILYITLLQIHTYTCIRASNTFKHHLFLKYPTELSI